ncbi:MAGUK p55 subfamily member 4-like isoform X2 [Antennarius striatus]|uniref:MAGUK p55 subfamily member 4-like isoform X2 n=1 Tax=Antennarius striatus TaxID=241820 RepID=UPI0035B0A303
MEHGVILMLCGVLEDVGEAVLRDVGGADLLHQLLSSPWLQALLKIYERLLQFQKSTPNPILTCGSGLSHEVLAAVQMAPHPSPESLELCSLLDSPHLQALLLAHDCVARGAYGPVLPPVPDEMPEDEEAMRIVCLVKNNQPLGATIRRDEETGEIYIARVIHGGLADRSGLLRPGDLLVEVNGNQVVGLDPEEVIQILINSQGTILFKVIPDAAQSSSSQKSVYMRAMVNYCPLQDSSIPCPDAGMAFSQGDLLEVVDQSDGQWWQARKLPRTTSCAGLIPSASKLKRRQREQWWCQPSQVHTCIRPLDDQTHTQDEHLTTELEDDLVGEDDDVTDGLYLAGFRRSFRLSRRMSYRRTWQPCSSCSPSSSLLSSPYEEVTLYQRHPQEKPRLIILIGASGVGVDDLRTRLIRLNPSTFQGPVPHTTRPIRAGEETGREYHFVTKELFEYMVCNHRFVEFGQFKGHLYGTSSDAMEDVLKRGRLCLIDVDPRSIQSLRTWKLKPYVIFIKAPCVRNLKQTGGRTISNDTVNRTLTDENTMELEEASRLMEAKYKQFFDSILVMDDLQDACMKLCSIIQQAQDQPQWIPVSWRREE